MSEETVLLVGLAHPANNVLSLNVGSTRHLLEQEGSGRLIPFTGPQLAH